LAGRARPPWPTARGSPPATDYFFNTAGLLPGFSTRKSICASTVYSESLKNSARFLFDFWGNIRKEMEPRCKQYSQLVFSSDIEVKAPIAAYHHVRKLYDAAGSVLIQHGSYQWISDQAQPYRTRTGPALSGYCEEHGFPCLHSSRKISPVRIATSGERTWVSRRPCCPIRSCPSHHSRSRQSLRDRRPAPRQTWLGDEVATTAGLDIKSAGFANELFGAPPSSRIPGPSHRKHRNSGPHYVVLKTPLSNLRITTFFAGESEVKIVDPSRVSAVETVGCQMESIRARSESCMMPLSQLTSRVRS